MKVLFIRSTLACAITLTSSLFSVLPGIDMSYVQASEDTNKVEKKRKRTPALGARVYSQLARAQEVADAGDMQAGLDILDQVKSKSSSLNSYERAMLHNFYGFIYYNAGKTEQAIAEFEQVVAQDPIPESLEKGTLFSLAQLSMANGNYGKTISFLDRWDEVNQGLAPINNNVLRAQASYQSKDYKNAAKYIESVITQAAEQETEAEETWYILQRAVYFELKDNKKVTAILEQMVRLFNKPEYWLQLAGMYGELEQEDKQLAVMEAAYQQGYVTQKSELMTLSQIYYFNGLPYKAAKVLSQGIEQKIIEKNAKNLKFLAQSWQGAKEADKAIAVLNQLASITDDGNADLNIAEIYLQQGKSELVIKHAEQAITRGKLNNSGNAYLALGMANVNLKQLDSALEAFKSAKEIPSSQRMATQWLKFVEQE
ncbi:tetratricopeptide repeat protein, partial [uncultured Psychrosphaera sp.]|uniref:tetratricopeptide repeat protein n=1 Tax=uncultured Psychrosphaera sp. TaxID=1403522 RepID=UPI0030FB7636